MLNNHQLEEVNDSNYEGGLVTLPPSAVIKISHKVDVDEEIRK